MKKTTKDIKDTAADKKQGVKEDGRKDTKLDSKFMKNKK